MASRLAAVLAPIPGTPGRPSLGSPRRVAKSAYCSGRMPYRATSAAASMTSSPATPRPAMQHPDGAGVVDQLEQVAVAGDDVHRHGGPLRQGGDHVVGLVLEADGGDAEGGQRLEDDRDLLGQPGRLGLARRGAAHQRRRPGPNTEALGAARRWVL